MTASEVEQIVTELKSFQINQRSIERKVNEIHQGLYGVPNTVERGLRGQVDEHEKRINKLWIIVIIIIASGIGGNVVVAKILEKAMGG